MVIKGRKNKETGNSGIVSDAIWGDVPRGTFKDKKSRTDYSVLLNKRDN